MPLGGDLVLQQCAFKLPKVSIRRDLHHNLVTHVPGFQFPIRREDDLERLEFLVKSNPIVRHQYVGYLATKKPRTVSIVQCFRMFFADEALRRYNWNGLDSPRYPKRPMKNYDIFTSCMLEAWHTHGVNWEELKSMLRKAIHKMNNRRYSIECHRRKKLACASMFDLI